MLNLVPGQISLLLTLPQILAQRGGSAECCERFVWPRSLRVGKSRRVTKIENKIVAAPVVLVEFGSHPLKRWARFYHYHILA
jgi:hypothetical protein